MDAQGYGTEEGELCRRDGCCTRIALTEPENCSCHIAAPCGSCTDIRPHCPSWCWDQMDEAEPAARAAVLLPNRGWNTAQTLEPLQRARPLNRFQKKRLMLDRQKPSAQPSNEPMVTLLF